MRDSVSLISHDLVYLQWFRRNSLLKCASQPKIAKKFTEPLYFGGSRSLNVIDVGTSGKLVSSAGYDKSICNRSRSRRVNSGKWRFRRGTPLWCPRSRGISSPSGTKFGQKTLRYHTVKSWVSISPGLEPGRERQTDRITIASMCLALRAIARKKINERGR